MTESTLNPPLWVPSSPISMPIGSNRPDTLPLQSIPRDILLPAKVPRPDHVCEAGHTMLTRSQIDRAGERLRRSPTPSEADRRIYDEFRAGFAEPLNDLSLSLTELAGGMPARTA